MKTIIVSFLRRLFFFGFLLSLFVTVNMLLQSPRPVHAAVVSQSTPPASGPKQTPVVPSGDADSSYDRSSNIPPNADAVTGGDGFDVVNNIIFTIVKVVIGFMYLIMILSFIVGSVKNASFSMVAQKFGMANMMSTELMNLVGGVVLFLLGLATLPAVNWVIDKAATLINGINIVIPNINPSIHIRG
jgi:hypothetical protein